MPGGDGTGPLGKGPMTGRVAGFCAGYPITEYMPSGYIQGYGRGRGRGFRRGFWGCFRRFWYRDYYDTPFNQLSTKEEKAYLEKLVKNLEDELKVVKERLQDLAKEKKVS